MLILENIDVYYGEFQVLEDVSMEAESGSTAIVVGPNGAGKTTLLSTISGLLRPRSGAIYFDGDRIDTKETHQITEMGIALVPEGGRVFPALNVYENLKVGAFNKRARKYFKDSIENIFVLFPILKAREKQLAGSLSGGERQMLSIARSLMSKPKLIMLDEPSSGLAPMVVSMVFDFVEKINKGGYSILMVEQNARKALQLADYAYLLESGKVLFEGGKEDFGKSSYIEKAYLGL